MANIKPQMTYYSKVKSKYELLEFIGSGAFGVVIKAKLRKYNKIIKNSEDVEKVLKVPATAEKRFLESMDPNSSRHSKGYNPRGVVVLKRIYTSCPANSDPYEHLKNVEKEIRMLTEMRNLKHVNLVKLLTAVVEIPPENWIEEFDEYWPLLNQAASEKFSQGEKMCVVSIAQEYCRLGSLSNWLYDDANNDRNLCWDLAPNISDGLRFLHDRGIIHRDLKPDNILLSSVSEDCGGIEIRPGEFAVLKIGDFGLAKILPTEVLQDLGPTDEKSIEMTTGVGTNLYKAPELDKSEGYDSSVDIYVGIILLEMFVKFSTKNARVLPITLIKYQDNLTPAIMEWKLLLQKATPVWDDPMASLIGKMMSQNPESRPDVNFVHNELLSFTKRSLKFPIVNIPRVIDSVCTIPRNELKKLLELYDTGCENIVFLTGTPGSGKTNLALQFAQSLESRKPETPSIHFITVFDSRNIKTYLVPIALSLKAEVNRSNGFRRTTEEIVDEILTGFQGRSVFILDGCGTTPEHNVCITSFWKSIRTITNQENKPFVLITTRASDYFQQFKEQKNVYSKFKLEGKKHFEDCKMALQNVWKDTEDLELPLEMKLQGFSAEEGIKFMENRLASLQNKDDTDANKKQLLSTLENHPFRLELSVGVINVTRKHFDPNFSIQEYLEYLGDVELKYEGMETNRIPGVDDMQEYTAYSDDRMDRIVMFIARQTIRLFPDDVGEKIQEIKLLATNGLSTDYDKNKCKLSRGILSDLGILREDNMYPFNNIFSAHLPHLVAQMTMSSKCDFDDEFAYAENDSLLQLF